jgi:selenocysteine lyase/cysteine desulfurase
MVIRKHMKVVLPNQGHYFNEDALYKRYTPAGPDHAQVAACAGMADYVDMLYAHHFSGEATTRRRTAAVHSLMRNAETALLQPLLDYVSGKNSMRLLGPATAANRAPTVAIELATNAEQAAAALAPLGIMAGGGDFYAVRALEAQGVDPAKGVLRLSFVHYTSREEVDGLIAALDQTL